MDKGLKVKQMNYQESKTEMSNNVDKKTSFSTWVNNDLNEVIHDLVEKNIIPQKLDFFIPNSDYL